MRPAAARRAAARRATHHPASALPATARHDHALTRPAPRLAPLSPIPPIHARRSPTPTSASLLQPPSAPPPMLRSLERVLVQAPLIDRFDVEAPVAANLERRQPSAFELPIDRRRMHLQVIRQFLDREYPAVLVSDHG